MNSNLMIFENPEFGELRSLRMNGEPWFVGRDVAMALGYGKGKSLNNAVSKHVDDEDKGVTEMMTPGGKQNVIIINESGLYALVLSSKLERAKKFKRWVTAEVLPSIVEAVKGQITILVDGGIRSGVDVFRAIALGADGVLIGRPLLPMIYAAGEEGFKVYMDKIIGELKSTMTM